MNEKPGKDTADRESDYGRGGLIPKSQSLSQSGVVIKVWGAASRKWFEGGVCGEERGEPWMFVIISDGVCSRQ